MRFCYLVNMKRILLLTFFGLLGISALSETILLTRALQKTENLAQKLRDSAREFRTIQADIQRENAEQEFLRGLVNVLPQEKNFIRTQRAMAWDVDVLRYKVSRRVHNDIYVVVDIRANKLYVKRGLTLLWQADCSVGKGGMLKDKKTGQRWEFVTPRGQFEIHDKIANPLWIKPDWAFVESGEKVPPPGDASRAVKDELGAFVMNLGDGYLIHGTKNEAMLGHPASHGCVRLGRDDLKRLYDLAPRGTRVYIY
jgi:hypothetical protein